MDRRIDAYHTYGTTGPTHYLYGGEWRAYELHYPEHPWDADPESERDPLRDQPDRQHRHWMTLAADLAALVADEDSWADEIHAAEHALLNEFRRIAGIEYGREYLLTYRGDRRHRAALDLAASWDPALRWASPYESFPDEQELYDELMAAYAEVAP